MRTLGTRYPASRGPSIFLLLAGRRVGTRLMLARKICVATRPSHNDREWSGQQNSVCKGIRSIPVAVLHGVE